MKKYLFFAFFTLLYFEMDAQLKLGEKKYPSLFWEITGKGLKKPSYLFGTMHVSSKIAFHLSDSFYLGIQNVDVVALETNPESWQEDMNNFEFSSPDLASSRFSNFLSQPNEFLSIDALKYYQYEKLIEKSLYSTSSTIDNLLYRSYGNEASDFEENTFLDMYIYQCGKKSGKKVAGVEDYGESMRLVAEAYKDAARDKNKKEKSYEFEAEYSQDKLQEAYRTGNLDLLDTITKHNSFSAVFDEKFLYKRNEIQAYSIDSIIKSGKALFVGVGAAHLPGSRGVIEILRKLGYKLRPIKMGVRDSKEKDKVEKIRVPVSFRSASANDGFFTVDIPGKFYRFGEDPSLDQVQYADMANGSYYMVTRVATNAWMWGHSQEDVYKKVDSLLYDNVPGKIITKAKINRNGYPGFDILNKTRRGDFQRYNIFITPFEILFFKMSGNGEYVRLGDEANRFFGSIKLKEWKTGSPIPNFIKYTPVSGGFSINFPHEPFTFNNGSWIFEAMDKMNSNYYRVIRTDVHNYHFAEEDTFDLALLEESFSSSEFIKKQISRRLLTHNGYPALDCKFLAKNGVYFFTRFIIQGPHYYSLIASTNKETADFQSFFKSFVISPFIYKTAFTQYDTSLYFTVQTPYYPVSKKEKIGFSEFDYGEDEDGEANKWPGSHVYRNKIISNDTTGEKIYINFFRSSQYFESRDSLDEQKDSLNVDSDWIIRVRKKQENPGKLKIREEITSDTGSSRMVWSKSFSRNGIGYTLQTMLDTLTKPSSFIQSFYDSFTPSDTLAGINPYEKKSKLFFKDFMSQDSTDHKRAVKNIEIVSVDSTDLPLLINAISSLGWKEKKYLEVKKELIGKLDDIQTKSATDYLKRLYYSATDTIDLQYAILETILQQKTSYAYSMFRDIITADPPVLDLSTGNSWSTYSIYNKYGYYNSDNGSFLDELQDSLELTKEIFPDLLPLVNLDDYKTPVMELLAKLIDSNMITADEYTAYFTKFLLEAKQELKKQVISEKNKAIEKAEENKSAKLTPSLKEEDKGIGNDKLNLYASLL